MMGRHWLLTPEQKQYQVWTAEGAYSQMDLGPNPCSTRRQYFPPLVWSIKWVPGYRITDTQEILTAPEETVCLRRKEMI